jgi:hypothetical protein
MGRCAGNIKIHCLERSDILFNFSLVLLSFSMFEERMKLVCRFAQLATCLRAADSQVAFFLHHLTACMGFKRAVHPQIPNPLKLLLETIRVAQGQPLGLSLDLSFYNVKHTDNGPSIRLRKVFIWILVQKEHGRTT